MIGGGERVGVAVSGGPDSVAMLRALLSLKEMFSLSLTILHFDHGLRASSRDDAAFVDALGSTLCLRVSKARRDVGALAEQRNISIEMAARAARYEFFANAVKSLELDRVAVGHNSDDAVETVLMRMLRGGSRGSLAGIPATRGAYIRPLIRVDRELIRAYLKQIGQAYRLDPMNNECSILRNHIRHHLVPRMREYNPRFGESISHITSILDDEDDFLETCVDEWWHRYARCVEKKIKMPLEELCRLHPAIGKRVIRKALLLLSPLPEKISHEHIRAIWASSKNRRFRHDLPEGLFAEGDGQSLDIMTEQARESVLAGFISLNIPGQTEVKALRVVLESEIISVSALGSSTSGAGSGEDLKRHIANGKDEIFVDADTLRYPVLIRTRRKGDRLRPLGMDGRKKLQDVFVDEKIPDRERDSVAILESGGEIIWVVGLKINDDFKITDKTQRVLNVKRVSL